VGWSYNLTILIIEFINYLNFRFTKSSLETSNYGNQYNQWKTSLLNRLKALLVTYIDYKRRLSAKLPLLNKRYWVKILNFIKLVYY
jgi:hypothetical protein